MVQFLCLCATIDALPGQPRSSRRLLGRRVNDKLLSRMTTVPFAFLFLCRERLAAAREQWSSLNNGMLDVGT